MPDGFHDVGAELRSGYDLRPFLCVSRRLELLAVHPQRHVPDVVEKRSRAKLFETAGRYPDSPSDGVRDGYDAARVTLRHAIAVTDGVSSGTPHTRSPLYQQLC